jgi:Rod binding domain-containing protein
VIPAAGNAVASLLAGEIDTARLRGGSGREATRAAAVALEVTFFAQLLSAMRDTIPDSGLLPRSPARTTYEGMFDRSIAEKLAAEDPLGLVERLTPPGGEP